MSSWVIPGILAAVALCGCIKRLDVYQALGTGAASGLSMMKTLMPTLVILLAAMSMVKESGFLSAMTEALRPLFSLTGIPPEVLPLMLLRPISGSAALAMGAELIAVHGPDSLIGRTAAVMLGSTETTFYALGVYFGAAGVKARGYTVFAALMADLAGFLSAALFARLL